MLDNHKIRLFHRRTYSSALRNQSLINVKKISSCTVQVWMRSKASLRRTTVIRLLRPHSEWVWVAFVYKRERPLTPTNSLCINGSRYSFASKQPSFFSHIFYKLFEYFPEDWAYKMPYWLSSGKNNNKFGLCQRKLCRYSPVYYRWSLKTHVKLLCNARCKPGVWHEFAVYGILKQCSIHEKHISVTLVLYLR